jgi:hypothetical protein
MVGLKEFVLTCGQRYSEVLGIKLGEGADAEIFKWLLASLLFGAPITESAAVKTFRCFEQHDVLTLRKIIHTGWEGLVAILDEGGYTRYDYKTADKLLEVTNNLVKVYGGSLSRVHGVASGERDLERRLKGLGKGVGDVKVSIFLRELRGIWEKADPYPTGLAVLAGEQLGILEKGLNSENALIRLKAFWAKNEVEGLNFVHFETALIRLGKECRRGKCCLRLSMRLS